MEQVPPAMGRTADKHSSQTGRREIFTRGVPQRRQSAGNRVAKRLSAILLAHKTKGLSFAAILVALARAWSPLLLKTNLLRPAYACWAITGRVVSSIRFGRRRLQRANACSHYFCDHLELVTLPKLDEYRSIRTPVTTSTTDWAQKEQWQEYLLEKAFVMGAIPLKTPASLAVVPSRLHGTPQQKFRPETV